MGASERSLGKKYKDAVRWKQSSPMSEKLSNLVLRECKAEQFKDCDLVFSGLNSDIAGETGKTLISFDGRRHYFSSDAAQRWNLSRQKSLFFPMPKTTENTPSSPWWSRR